MSARAVLVVVVLAGAGGIYWAGRAIGRGADPEDTVQRAAPALPRPDEAAKARFFFELVRSGEQTRVGGNTISTWRAIGEPALVRLGTPALDHMLAEERTPLYRAEPSQLSNVLNVLPKFPGAGAHPRLYPFLNYWLDPGHAPPKTPGADWAEDWRRLIFVVLGRFPQEAAVAACVAELDRTKRTHDLRIAAMDVLFAVGRADLVADRFDALPPNEKEPDQDLKLHLHQRFYLLVAPGQPEMFRDQVARLEPLVRRGLESETPMVRILSAATLLRLGQNGAAEPMLAEYEKHPDSEVIAWSALIELVRDRPHERAGAIARARLEKPDGSVAYTSAVRMAAWWQLDDDAVRAEIWRQVRARTHVAPLMVLPRLLRVDRPGVVAYLEEELRRDEWSRVEEAVRFGMREGLRELGPALLALARDVPRVRRPLLYAALAQLRVRGVVPLLEASLDETNPDPLRDAAATELLNLGEGLGLLAEAVERGDPIVLDALGRRALASGERGIPAPLVGVVAGRVRHATGEEGRLAALFTLRCRGTLEGVRDALIEAYRREPSRRVAAAIRATLLELAHR